MFRNLSNKKKFKAGNVKINPQTEDSKSEKEKVRSLIEKVASPELIN